MAGGRRGVEKRGLADLRAKSGDGGGRGERRMRRCRELVISANVQAMKRGLENSVRAYPHLADHLTQCITFL